jgi:ammonia channel protein AmtB
MSQFFEALSKFVVMCMLAIMASIAVYWGEAGFTNLGYPIGLVALGVGLTTAALLILAVDGPRTRAALKVLGVLIFSGTVAVILHGFVVSSELAEGRLGGVQIDLASVGRTLIGIYAFVALLAAPAGVVIWKVVDIVERAKRRTPAES